MYLNMLIKLSHTVDVYSIYLFLTFDARVDIKPTLKKGIFAIMRTSLGVPA